MSAKVIDGKELAERLHAILTQDVIDWLALGNPQPMLAVVLVGDDPASKVYVQSKTRKAKAAGIGVRDVKLPADTTDAQLQEQLRTLSADEAVDGILLQLPLPKGLDEFAALMAISPDKDVDGLHPFNQGLLLRGAEGFKPCTPFGCMLLIREGFDLLHKPYDLSGLHAVVVGRSILVGKPMAHLLLEQHCTVTVCHSRTKNLTEICQQADILIGAVGRPELLGAAHIKPGAIVIDVGINRLESGGLVGDVDFGAALDTAGAITPVPGGVGPLTITVLLQNTVWAAKRRVQQRQ